MAASAGPFAARGRPTIADATFGNGSIDSFALALPTIAVSSTGAIWAIDNAPTSPAPTPDDGRILGTTGPFVPSTLQIGSGPTGPWTSGTASLPAGTLAGLQAADVTTAWAEVSVSENDPEELLVTTDGGRKWLSVLSLLPSHGAATPVS